MKAPTFPRGGVHPADRKEISKDKPIEYLPLPGELVVSLSQHLGAPAKALKAKGDHVERGEKIGEAAGFISAAVHSPVSGTITDIRKVRLATSAVADAYVITPDAEQPAWPREKHDWRSEDPKALLALISDMGVVGMGGATFPTNVKLSVPPEKAPGAIIVNGVECEPYLTADYRVELEKADEAIQGALIAQKVAGAKKVYIGVELNKPDAIAHLKDVAREKGYDVEVVGLKMKYPQGDEKNLIKAILGREVISGKLPLDAGAVICNIGTCNAIYEACVCHKPLVERVVSVTGECIKEPKNLVCPIGAKVGDILAYCGGFAKQPDKLISGGPMMGFAFSDPSTPITKGTSGITCLEKQREVRQTPCLNCGKCVAACPMGLMPAKMYRLIIAGKYAEAMASDLMDCKECGCCAFSCPAGLPLVHAFKTGKRLGRKKK